MLEFMLQNGNQVDHINIHSDHAVGMPRMAAFAEKHFPRARLTFNSV